MIFSVIIALLVSFQSIPQDTTDLNNLSVGKALEIAYEHSPQVNQLKNRIEAQKQQAGLSLGVKNPTVTYAKEGIGQGTFGEQRWMISQSMDFPLTGYYRVKS